MTDYSDLGEALKFVIPIAFFLIWKFCNAQRSTRSTSVLGLADSKLSSSSLALLGHQTRYLRMLYAVTSGLTFGLGVLSFHAFMFLQELAALFLP